MSMAKRLLVIALVLVCCVGCDRMSKTCAAARLSTTQPVSFLGGALVLQLAHNEGAFLGLGSSFFARGPWSVCAARLVFAGGLSNLADRFLHDGYVLDFINVGFGTLRTGIFNLADVAIMAGVVMLLIGRRESRRTIWMR